jgi:hypothetical protein
MEIINSHATYDFIYRYTYHFSFDAENDDDQDHTHYQTNDDYSRNKANSHVQTCMHDNNNTGRLINNDHNNYYNVNDASCSCVPMPYTVACSLLIVHNIMI